MSRLNCLLICPNNSHEPIEIPEGETICIGRGVNTKVTDTKVSRNHVELRADYEKLEVSVKAIGSNPCEVDGRQLSKGETALLRNRGSLHLLPGKFETIVQFMSGRKNLGKRCAGKNGNPVSAGPTKTKQAKLNFDKINSKMDASDESDHSDSEHIDDISKKLEILKENAKKKVANNSGDEVKVGTGSVASSSNGSKKAIQGDKPAESSVWEDHDRLLIYTAKGVLASSKIASYDMDGTIITTQSGKVFPTSYSDWRILLPEIPGKLKQLLADGYKIVFCSNQMGIEKGRVKPAEFKTKVESIIAKLGIPIQMFIAAGSGVYRKPALGMWTHLVEKANDNIPVDLDASFFVGDAAGRPKDWLPGRKKDFSCSDRMFALNIGISFHTPEEHFLGQKAAAFEMPSFDPRKLNDSASLLEPASAKIKGDAQEIIVLVGNPAAGKSSFVATHLIPLGYTHINRDTLKTWQKCVQAAENAVKEGQSVVIDNTNPDIESRKRYVDVAKAAGISCRCFVMNVSLDQCLHNERFRELTDKNHQMISQMVFNSYKSKFQEPKLSEGFKEIVKVNFVSKFKSSTLKELYQKFLVEK